MGDIMKADRKRDLKMDLAIAASFMVAGLAISGYAAAGIYSQRFDVAQVTHPLQSTPGAENKPSAPSTTGQSQGTRPADVAPQPARPDPNEVKAGTPEALPPAPAEKSAAPVPTK
jgi:hypothetical protein